MLHIGLTQRVDDLPDRKERREGLDHAWATWVLEAGHLPVLLPNQPAQAENLLNELEIDALILTGGNDLSGLPEAKNAAPQRDAFERNLLDIACRQRMPVLGVCRGMQMMVHYHGGRLIRIDGHVRVPHAVACVGEGMPSLPRVEVNSFHSFGTRPELLPEVLLANGLAPDGTVEAIIHRSLPQWAIMWHPERTVGISACGFDNKDITLLNKLLEALKA